VATLGVLRILLGLAVLGGLGCLVTSVFVSPATSEILTVVAVGLAGLGVGVYLVDGWRSGSMGARG
jgi:hypothetical protein